MAEVLRIFAHLRKYLNTELMFDPSDPVVDELAFEGKEEIPINMPESRGVGFVMRAKVDADHA
eukprot:6608710-Ditylum_brightwellii.AAC.1